MHSSTQINRFAMVAMQQQMEREHRGEAFTVHVDNPPRGMALRFEFDTPQNDFADVLPQMVDFCRRVLRFPIVLTLDFLLDTEQLGAYVGDLGRWHDATGPESMPGRCGLSDRAVEDIEDLRDLLAGFIHDRMRICELCTMVSRSTSAVSSNSL